MAIKSWPYPPDGSDAITAYLKRLYVALTENSAATVLTTPSKIDIYAGDPSTTGWGSTDTGRIWYNTVTSSIRGWNGTGVVTLWDRQLFFSTDAPTGSDGNNNDVWIQY